MHDSRDVVEQIAVTEGITNGVMPRFGVTNCGDSSKRLATSLIHCLPTKYREGEDVVV